MFVFFSSQKTLIICGKDNKSTAMAKICMPELQRNILRSYDESVGMFNPRGEGAIP